MERSMFGGCMMTVVSDPDQELKTKKEPGHPEFREYFEFSGQIAN
jgi:hypothetical protein